MEEEIEEGEDKGEMIARAVLLFCALVVAGVAAYTTFMLFAAYEIDISFSPPEAAGFEDPLAQDGDFKGTASFDIEKEATQDGEVKEYEDQPIKPFVPGESLMPSPLVITEDIDGKGRLVFIVIALEVILIGLIYWRLDKRLRK